MLFDRDTADLLAAVGAGAGVLGLILGATAQVRLSRMRRAYTLLQGHDSTDDFITAVNRHLAEVGAMRGEVGQVRADVTGLRADLGDALRHVAVVRYDAFPDMGGRLSFSCALLDDAGDGLVLTSINGRSETRTYAKGVKAGKSEHSLSPEENQALSFADRDSRKGRR